jgi:4-hydroxyphenylpyruvate dioxygenase
MEPTKMKDEGGEVILSTVQTYGDTTHTFVQRDKFEGKFLPDFN